jgi:hypothetical protein
VATSSYMEGRRSFLNGSGRPPSPTGRPNPNRAKRPQALLFSNNSGTLDNGSYVPTGIEGTDFIILTDGNRSEISMSQQRIETRQRMVNGNMRSYWTADKLNLSTSWNRIPSRAFSTDVGFDEDGFVYDNEFSMYTVDGGAGGVDMLSWYEDHAGPFYVFLGYDKFDINGTKNFNKMSVYNQVLKMYISSFDYSIEKRGGTWSSGGTATGFDFWNINISLEEV